MARAHAIAVIGGDGIGPEVTRAALRVLDAAERRFGFTTVRTAYDWSSERYLGEPRPITREHIEELRRHDAILFGAIGDPRLPRGQVERDVILGMRRGLDLFVNLRPIVAYDDRLVPMKGKTAADVDMIVVRENTEDVYTQTGAITGSGRDQVAEVPMRFTRPGIERVVRYAYELARTRPRRKLTLVDKANAIPVQQLWRDILEEIGASYPDVAHDAMYVDAACMWMLQRP
jgi:3-isopropylmalate dehydrogenase